MATATIIRNGEVKGRAARQHRGWLRLQGWDAVIVLWHRMVDVEPAAQTTSLLLWRVSSGLWRSRQRRRRPDAPSLRSADPPSSSSPFLTTDLTFPGAARITRRPASSRATDLVSLSSWTPSPAHLQSLCSPDDRAASGSSNRLQFATPQSKSATGDKGLPSQPRQTSRSPFLDFAREAPT